VDVDVAIAVVVAAADVAGGVVVPPFMKPSSPSVTRWFESKLLIYALIVVAQSVMTEVAQPLQRGSFASSHAKTAVEVLYRLTTALM
jgi:hypothetical protein